jgi:ApaG protein
MRGYLPAMTKAAHELPGLEVQLDQLVYYNGPNLPEETPHAFIYYITIRNQSDRAVTFLRRKWVLREASGEQLVIEGDAIVGEKPRLEPGQTFSYNSYHVTRENAVAEGSFHGVDVFGEPVFVRIPQFELKIPNRR